MTRRERALAQACAARDAHLAQLSSVLRSVEVVWPAPLDDESLDEALLALRVEWERSGLLERHDMLRDWDRTMSELQNTIAVLRALLAR